jgi:outer membrane protein assembly factor BamB
MCGTTATLCRLNTATGVAGDWSTTMIGGEALTFNLLFSAPLNAVVFTTLRYVGALDADTGEFVFWGQATPYGAVSFTTSPALSSNGAILVVGMSNGELACFSTFTWEQLWRVSVTRVAGGVKNPPVIVDDLAYVHTSGNVTALVLATGAQSWITANAVGDSVQAQVPLTLLRSFVSPTVHALAASITRTSGSAVVIYNAATGAVIRTITVASCGAGCSPAVSAVSATAAADGALFVSATDQNTYITTLYRVNAATGGIDFSIALPPTSSLTSPSYVCPIVGRDWLYFTDFSGITSAFPATQPAVTVRAAVAACAAQRRRLLGGPGAGRRRGGRMCPFTMPVQAGETAQQHVCTSCYQHLRPGHSAAVT